MKMLSESSEKSWLGKIKSFFKKIFFKKEKIKVLSQTNNETIDNKPVDRSTFSKTIKNVENEETKILNLQRRYESGAVSVKNMEIEQIKSLWDLYNKQILNLKKSNEFKRQEILQYRKNSQEN